MKKITYLMMGLLIISSVFGQWYNETDISGANNIYEFTLAVDKTTSTTGLNTGIIGIGILLIVFVIAFVITSVNTFNGIAGLAVASWITALVGMILLPLGMISFDIYIYVLILVSLSTFLAILFSKG